MLRCGMIFAVLTFMPPGLSIDLQARAQQSEETSKGDDKVISDCEKAGLRGPVRTVEEEGTYAGATNSDGSVDREMKSWKKTEYDREGRVAARWNRGSSREHGLGKTLYVTRYTYNASGQLQRMTAERDGEADGETIYHYDDRGRLENITDSKDPGNPIAFHYDADGRKRKIAIAQPVAGPAGVGEQMAVSYSPEYLFDAGSGLPGMPSGGSTTTLYDSNDRPIEVQMHDASGRVMFRVLRVYDDQGRVVEEKTSMDDVLSMIPAAGRKQMMDQGGVTEQELREKITEALGGGSEMSSTKYTYDAQGRKTLSVSKLVGNMEQRLETSYNEHGDVAKEISQDIGRGAESEANAERQTVERIFSYEYDANGNWTVKKVSSRELPGGELKDSVEVERRTIEYF